MTVLYRTNCRNKQRIAEEFFPFSHPEQIRGMIIGNDLDSLLSAAFLKTKFGWDVAAVYDYVNFWYQAESTDFKRDLTAGKYVAIGLDIYHANIPRASDIM